MNIPEDRIPKSIREQAGEAKFGTPDFYAGPLIVDPTNSSGEIPPGSSGTRGLEEEMTKAEEVGMEKRTRRQEQQPARRLFRHLRIAR
jgi:hypothetical protein